jgi:hypothetical protein
MLSQYSTKYPNNYEIQLKNLAEQFETIFNTADAKRERAEGTTGTNRLLLFTYFH